MSRYTNSIEVKNPKALMIKLIGFLRGKGFTLGKRHGETVWIKSGFMCRHCIITESQPSAVAITAFIIFNDAMSGRENESTIKGFIGGFGKWPLKKVVRNLEKFIRENKDFTGFEIGVPRIFTDKYTNYPDDTNEAIKLFNKDFGLEEYALPNGFLEFAQSNRQHRINDNYLSFEPIEYDKILDIAYDLLYGSDVFLLPPYCVPFAIDESGHNVYALDYRECGKKGDPKIISIDNETDIKYENNEDVSTYIFTENIIAHSFAEFMKMCGIAQDNWNELDRILFKLKNANIDDVEISPADKDFPVRRLKKEYSFLPQNYISFLCRCNGLSSSTFYLCGFDSGFGVDAPSLELKQQYLDGYGKGYKAEDWFFIGGDGMGGEYAFPSDAPHETVYYFDHEFPDVLEECGSFIEFLEEEIDTLIEISKT